MDQRPLIMEAKDKTAILSNLKQKLDKLSSKLVEYKEQASYLSGLEDAHEIAKKYVPVVDYPKLEQDLRGVGDLNDANIIYSKIKNTTTLVEYILSILALITNELEEQELHRSTILGMLDDYYMKTDSKELREGIFELTSLFAKVNAKYIFKKDAQVMPGFGKRSS
jgi:hypothetical protein